MPRKNQILPAKPRWPFPQAQRDSDTGRAEMNENLMGLGSLCFSVTFCSR